MRTDPDIPAQQIGGQVVTFSLEKSAALFAASRQVMPGGVNSPVRSFRSVGGTPPFVVRGEGSRIYDVDGNSYIDYCLSWGPLVLGHAHPEVVAALQAQAARGTSFGIPTELELEMAREILAWYPGMEMVRLVNSGTEATMSAVRVARAATGRSKVIKFVGNYHGHGDMMLVSAGSGAADLGVPDSPGVPVEAARNTLSLPYNDLVAVEEAFRRWGEEIACVIVEPVAGNMGLVLPRPGFLEGLRRVTAQYGALLIFDEVLCGFRLPGGTAARYYGIDPDLACLGKVIGGGLPVGAYGGKRRYMELVAPAGPVYQAGTLSGNPLAVTAGLTQLRILRRPGVMERLEAATRRLVDGLNGVLADRGLPYRAQGIGSLWGLFFSPEPVYDYEGARQADAQLYARVFHGLLRRGVYWAPSQLEAGFMSLAHSDADIDATVAAFAAALAEALG